MGITPKRYKLVYVTGETDTLMPVTRMVWGETSEEIELVATGQYLFFNDGTNRFWNPSKTLQVEIQEL